MKDSNNVIICCDIIDSLTLRLEPRINVRSVRVQQDPEDDNSLRVELDYKIIGETLVQTVDFLLEQV